MKHNLKVFTVEEFQQNDFYDSRRCGNGGGYDQPLYKFLVYDVDKKRKIARGTLDNSSCGDFGSRFYLDFKVLRPYGNHTHCGVDWGSMPDFGEWLYVIDDKDALQVAILEAIRREYPYYIPDREAVEINNQYLHEDYVGHYNDDDEEDEEDYDEEDVYEEYAEILT